MSILNDLLGVAKETFNPDTLTRVQQYTGKQFGTVEDYLEKTETSSDPDYTRGLIAGLIGGLVGVGVKMLVDRSLPTDQPKQEHDARVDVVQAIENFTGTDLTNSQEETAQTVVDLAVGIAIGGVYGVIAEAAPNVQAPGGVPFGAGLWTASHKIALPLLGLAPSTLRGNAERQLGQFAGHIAYGATVEIVRRGLRHLMEDEDLF